MRNARSLLLLILVAAISAPAALHGADKRQRIDSAWRGKDVAIDGDSGDWKGPLVQVDAKDPITAAAVNDGQFLYVVLSTSDPGMRTQILRQGLIVWFDPAGGTQKHFGVKYPVGAGSGEGWGAGRGGARRGPYSGGQAGERRNPDGADGDRPEPANRLEVLGPGKGDAHSFVTDMVPGIAVKVGEVQGALVYELKVPVGKSADFPYAIEAKPGALIGFGLDTPKMERPQSEGGRRIGGIGSGGLGGGGGGRGGMGGRGRGGATGGGRRGDGGFAPRKPLKTWATIQLTASAPR
jgi:hypothetical protein